jgi:3-oxoacyl-[acyl-carrier protein] reductase
MLLEGKNALLDGAGGVMGGGVARLVPSPVRRARVFLTGLSREPLDVLAMDMEANGGSAEVAVVDALDEGAVEANADDVGGRAGTLDVSFNVINRGDIQGTPLAEMSTSDFIRAVPTGLTAPLMARVAARRMSHQGASDRAAAITGTVVNVSCGLVPV